MAIEDKLEAALRALDDLAREIRDRALIRFLNLSVSALERKWRVWADYNVLATATCYARATGQQRPGAATQELL